jgi:ATP-binding protein involved in chromosome partitioning
MAIFNNTNKTADFTETTVLNALRTVKDPDLGKDLVTLDMIQDLKLTMDGKVSLRVVLTTPACPMKAKIESDIRAALKTISGITDVQIKMDAQVKSANASLTNRIEGVSNIIAVSSGKGGVGKSTVAVNLALTLAKSGAKVGLLDADIYGPNTPTMLGVTEQPMMEKDPVKGECIIPVSTHGIKLISMGFLLQGDQPVVWRGPMLHNILRQFCHQVQWGKLDYLVIDMPPGTGDVQLSLAQLIPLSGVVIVTTPQEVAMQDVRKSIHMFEKVRVPLLGVVENMSWFESAGERHYLFGKNGGEELARKFNTHLLGQLPIVQAIREGGDMGKPLTMTDPEGDTSKRFIGITEKVAQALAIQSAGKASEGQSTSPGRIEISEFN